MSAHKLSLVCLTLFLSSRISAEPTLVAGKVSGRAGASVDLPVAFNPGGESIAGMQFSLTLPTVVSTVSVTAGRVIKAAAKSVEARAHERTWTFIIYGFNRNAMASGTLLKARLKIAPEAAAGDLHIPVSGMVYTDAKGQSGPTGHSAAGIITVLPPKH